MKQRPDPHSALPPPKRGGIPKDQFCPGCGCVTDGRHLDRELLKDAIDGNKEKK